MTGIETDYIILGKIGAPYGIKGWVKITSFTAPISNILTYKPWYLAEGKTWQKIEIASGRPHGKGIVVKFANCATPEQARLLTGKNIAVLRSQLPVLAKDEYYWSDLEGLTVINQAGKVLGIVSYLIETGTNDVLVVKGEKEHAIPYLPKEVVLSIDLAKQIMYVDWDML